ncbi:MAG: hypothetical protein HS132_01375 [Planctomycetia bacterium]|nr:hypothetical protein [Planctomycetia bacterium]
MFIRYTGITLEYIYTQLRGYRENTNKLIQELEEDKSKVIKNKENIDNTQGIIRFIDSSITWFKRCLHDFDRLLIEIQEKVTDYHIDMFEAIAEIGKERDAVCINFKHDHIEKCLRDESMRPFLEGVYAKTRDIFGHYQALSNLTCRMETYIGTKLIQKSEKEAKLDNTTKATHPSGNVFYCKGGRWIITYKGETIYPRDSLYLKYIAHLLKHPYPKTFSYDELYLVIEGSLKLTPNLKPENQRIEAEKDLDFSVSNQIDGGEILDDVYIKNAKDAIKELENEKEDAEKLVNEDEVARLQEKINIIKNQCLDYVKHNGKSRKFVDGNKKAKVESIKKGILRCIDTVKNDSKKANHENLLIWNHLKQHIKLRHGGVSYEPKEHTPWVL